MHHIRIPRYQAHITDIQRQRLKWASVFNLTLSLWEGRLVWEFQSKSGAWGIWFYSESPDCVKWPTVRASPCLRPVNKMWSISLPVSSSLKTPRHRSTNSFQHDYSSFQWSFRNLFNMLLKKHSTIINFQKNIIYFK